MLNTAKNLLELLGQRTSDMARTEDLSTKLSYAPCLPTHSKEDSDKSLARTFKVEGSHDGTSAAASLDVTSPSYQTEVIPVPAITLTTSEPVGTSSLSPGGAFLTTSFVLHPKLPRPMDVGQPRPPPQFFTLFSLSKVLELPSPESSDNPSDHTPHESPPCMDEGNFMAPPTPGYPVAKSQAQRMVHAYSPVKSRFKFRYFFGTIKQRINARRELFPSEAEKEDEEMPLAQQLGIPVSPPESLSLKRNILTRTASSASGPTASSSSKASEMEVYTSASSPDTKAADVTAETLEEARQSQARHRYPGLAAYWYEHHVRSCAFVGEAASVDRCIRTETDTPESESSDKKRIEE
ncbi:hypothetical protein JOM56_007760 [Amanita muscaria]